MSKTVVWSSSCTGFVSNFGWSMSKLMSEFRSAEKIRGSSASTGCLSLVYMLFSSKCLSNSFSGALAICVVMTATTFAGSSTASSMTRTPLLGSKGRFTASRTTITASPRSASLNLLVFQKMVLPSSSLSIFSASVARPLLLLIQTLRALELPMGAKATPFLESKAKWLSYSALMASEDLTGRSSTSLKRPSSMSCASSTTFFCASNASP
mmetsp:Transcript_62727/g.116642  ORF Transcript_62727/g.116642 Transcript_62727/m.116642 type:complete len:210 (-) Transcript_62727:721-1350(-)